MLKISIHKSIHVSISTHLLVWSNSHPFKTKTQNKFISNIKYKINSSFFINTHKRRLGEAKLGFNGGDWMLSKYWRLKDILTRYWSNNQSQCKSLPWTHNICIFHLRVFLNLAIHVSYDSIYVLYVLNPSFYTCFALLYTLIVLLIAQD